MENRFNVKHLNDGSLLEGLKQHLSEERHSQALFLAHLAEVDERKLYAELGYTSLFAYCMEVLHLAEGSTCKRIQTTRSARKYPIIFSLIEKGEVHMTGVNLIAPFLKDDNYQDLLNQISGKTKREVEKIVASLAPQPDVAEQIRKLPAQVTTSGGCCKNGTLFDGKLDADHSDNFEVQEKEITELQVNAVELEQKPRYEVVKPLSPERYKIQLTGSERLKNKIERAKALLRHKYPEGRLEDILEAALDLLLEKKDPELKFKQKKTSVKKPFRVSQKPEKVFSPRMQRQQSTNTRYIPELIKHEVWARDHGQCSFVAEDGKCCSAEAWLEYDHIQPWALGGTSDNSANIRLLCRTHNQLKSDRIFGVYNKEVREITL